LGYCYIPGYFKSSSISFGSTILPNNGSSTADLFIIECKPDGDKIWAKSAGSTGDEFANSIAMDTLRNFYIAGYFSSTTFILGTTSLASAGSSDMFITKSDNTAVTGIPELNNNIKLSVFPKPAKDHIMVTLPQNATLEILNIQGQVCKKFRINQNETNIDIQNLSNGIYLIIVKTDYVVSTKIFIKE
jgi:hypothetical protein